MSWTRRFVLVALCALMPFVLATEASAVVSPPSTYLRLTVTLDVRPYSGLECNGKSAAVYQPQPIPLYSGADAFYVTYHVEVCRTDTRVVEWMITYTYFNSSTRREEVALLGVMSLQKKVSGVWKEQTATDIGKALKLEDSASGSFTISSGTGRATLKYKATTSPYLF